MVLFRCDPDIPILKEAKADVVEELAKKENAQEADSRRRQPIRRAS